MHAHTHTTHECTLHRYTHTHTQPCICCNSALSYTSPTSAWCLAHTDDLCCTPLLPWGPTTQHWFSGSKAVGGGLCSQTMATHCTVSQACSTLHMHYWSAQGHVARRLVGYDEYHRQYLTWTFLSNFMAIHHEVHRYLCGYHRSSAQDQHCVDY